MSTSPCLVCSQPGLLPCPACPLAACCPHHLGLHREGGACGAWRVQRRDGVGRVLVAAREVLPWQRVLSDRALARVWHSSQVCVECGLAVGEDSTRCACGLSR